MDDEYEITQVRGLTLSVNEKDEIQMIWFHTLMLSRTLKIDLNGWRQLNKACLPLKSSGFKAGVRMSKRYILQSCQLN